MATQIAQAQVPAIATTMMASFYGAIHPWDDTLTLTDLFGYSGHAFILNIERTLCPSGPTAWDWGAILFPLRQLFSLRRLCASCDMRGPEEARELIWQRVVESIDAGRAAVLWDALYPEFYLAYGYDAETGEYLIAGPGDDRVGHRVSWAKLGSNVGHVWAVFPSPGTQRDAEAARNLALRGAITWHRWANDPDAQWVFGGEAWDVWIAAMTEEEMALDAVNLSLNQAVYAECRRHAANFLATQGEEFAAAAEAYARVADALEAVCARWSFPAPPPALDVRREIAECLTTARDAECEAINTLEAALAPNNLLRA